MLGIAPAELLDDFEPHRLRALGIVRAQVDVDEAPAVAVRHLRAQPVHIVVVAGNGKDGRIEDRGTEQLTRLEIVWNDHATVDAETRGVCGDAVRQVAGGRAGEHVEPKLHRLRGRNRDDAVLIRERRMVDRVVLHVEFAHAEPMREAVAAHQRCEAGVESGARLAGDRKQLAVAPEILRPRFNLLARQVDGVVIVDRLERSETAVADVHRFRRKRRLAEMTLKSNQRAHTASANGNSEPSRFRSDV